MSNPKTPKTPKSNEVKTNTLFSYFKKSASKPKESDAQSSIANEERNAISEAQPSINCPPNVNTPPLKATPIRDTTAAKSSNGIDVEKDIGFEPGDLVWAKLEGHPWWPSLVCNHPKDGTISRCQGKNQLIHLQFFENPPSRGWAKLKFVRAFTGSDCKEFQRGGQLFSADPDCRKAADEADKAISMSKSERLGLVVTFDTSESEAEDDDEPMEVDKTSDNEKSDTENGVGKENETPPKLTPRKTPKKLTRSATNKSVKRRRIIESDSEGAMSDASVGDEFKIKEKSSEEEESSSEEESSEEDDASEEESEGSPSMSEPETPVKAAKRKRSDVKPRKKDAKPVGVVRSLGVSKNVNNKKSSIKMEKFAKTEKIEKTVERSPSHEPSPPAVATKSPESSPMAVVSDSTKSKLAAFSLNDSVVSSAGTSENRNFPHMSLDFLQPNKIRDAQKHLKDDPEYDPRTLFIPDSFLSKQTPAMRQWWVMKAEYFDTILFFKMGKFYELFHMDAMIAVNELGIIFMKGEHAHCGFPEIAYGRYSDTLIQKGYKVARVEQTETPEMMTERCKQMKSSSKLDKVVKREICSLQSKGTKRYSFIDGDTTDCSNNFLLAICEKTNSTASSSYGVCFVDSSIGKFFVGQFDDDRHGSRLRTLVSHYPPAQVLYERGKLSEKTQVIFNHNLVLAIKEGLRSGTEFWDGSKTLKLLSESEYFIDESNKDLGVQWPPALKQMISENDSLCHTPADNCQLTLSALGAVVWYLRHCLLDEELLSLRMFETYLPVDLDEAKEDSCSSMPSPSPFDGIKKHMVLDGVTLANLDVFVNGSTGTIEGTLLQRLDACKTPFGKRLFRQWLCSPLCNPNSIDERLNAIEDLMNASELVSHSSDLLSKLPDLERLLSKIHTLSSSRRSKNHPDSRAIFFEDVAYSKRKIEDFLLTLDGFKTATKLISKMQDSSSSFRSKLLKQCVTISNGTNDGRFPDMSKPLAFFDIFYSQKAFDHQKAKSAGVIKPTKGVNVEYDQAVADLQTFENDLNSYLEKQKKILGCRTVTYFGTAKNRYQMEVPDSASKNIPHEYEVTSQRKGFRRYQTEEIKRMFSQLTDAEERRDAAQKDTMRCVFFQFDKHYELWSTAVSCLSVLDVLISLANYSTHGEGAMCRPEIVSSAEEPFIEIRNGRHPCITSTFSGSDFIPNDTVIGNLNDSIADEVEHDSARVVLVTGPNMGGKSTLMRQVGIITIMAQLGCYVPAEKCRLTPVDRIFTRLGASDRIMSGESTFFVELSETSAVLQHATKHSLVLLDELGRGTATYDGCAIASVVVKELCDNIQCRTLFSTHYHSLVEEFSKEKNVRLGHMACMVENENDEDPSQETITFLYKFAPGACPKSYGFNAARLANIPDEIIRVAHKKAKEFEESVNIMRVFRNVWKEMDCNRLCEIVATVDIA